MLKFLTLTISCFLTILCTYAIGQDVQQDDESAIKDLMQKYYEAWNAHDAKKLALLYAEDGDIRTPWNTVGKNRKEVEEIFASQFNKSMKNSHAGGSSPSIRMLKPNLAFVDLESTITGMGSPQMGQYAPMHHHVAFILIKKNGKWEVLISRPF